jgi:hypothetical protein
MNQKRSRTGLLTSVATAVSAFGAAATMTTATARADDFTDVINAVDSDFLYGQEDFASAVDAFGDNEPAVFAANIFEAVDNDFISAPANLIGGSVELLDGESVTGPENFTLSIPSDFAESLTNAAGWLSDAQTTLEDGANLFAAGDYGEALIDDLFGADYATVFPLENLLMGLAASF